MTQLVLKHQILTFGTAPSWYIAPLTSSDIVNAVGEADWTGVVIPSIIVYNDVIPLYATPRGAVYLKTDIISNGGRKAKTLFRIHGSK